jgi:alanine-glyoxylate transaminase/serine-glyoxylate transaminase/serine-pyruvate transaminase
MPGRPHLFVPGPSNIPERVLRAMQRASEDHRGPLFPELTLPLFAAMRRLFGASAGEVALFLASGTGGWEVALTNALAPGAPVLLPCAGQFAALWGDAARRLGYQVETIPGMEWGDAPEPAAIGQVLAADAEHRLAAVLVVHNETSTGVTADVAAIRNAMTAAAHPALLLVDGVSSIGSLEYRHDEWGVDIALTGSQKGLMLPAGLALLAVSHKAMRTVNTLAPRSYFDLRAMLAQNATGYFPHTPSIPLLYGLREALTMLEEEGPTNVIARHHRLAAGVRAATAAWGLEICCRDRARVSDTVTTVMVPAGIDANALIRHAAQHLELALGGGLGPLSGRAFRIGHLGDLNEGMLLGALGMVEMLLVEAGVTLTLGSGVAAAQRRWSAAR